MGAFADDSFVSVVADSEAELKSNLEREGENILKFFTSNNMVANASKTAMIIFGKQSHETPFRISLFGEVIEERKTENVPIPFKQCNLLAHVKGLIIDFFTLKTAF